MAVASFITGPLSTARAVDLDAPGGKPVTIRTEIERGAAAARDLYFSGSLDQFCEAYFDLLNRNKQVNKDTEGFLLGAKGRFALRFEGTLFSKRIGEVNSERSLKSSADFARDLFGDVRAAQKRLEIADDQLAELLGVKSDIFKSRFALWSGPSLPAVPALAAPVVQQTLSKEEAQRSAIMRYPDLAIPGTKLHSAFIGRYRTYMDTQPEFFKESDWPLRLAEQCAALLNVDPVQSR